MNGNLLGILLVFPFWIVVWIIIYLCIFKKINKEKRCSNCTEGRVIGWSHVKHGGLFLPKVEYCVKDKIYHIVGPRFQHIKTISISTPFSDTNTKYETNIISRNNLPQSTYMKIYKNSLASVSESPLAKLYPIGSQVNVYYNHKHPKDAYVDRFEGVSLFLSVLMICLVIVMTGLLLFFIFGPELVLK